MYFLGYGLRERNNRNLTTPRRRSAKRAKTGTDFSVPRRHTLCGEHSSLGAAWTELSVPVFAPATLPLPLHLHSPQTLI